jgi:hypothetical protein
MINSHFIFQSPNGNAIQAHMASESEENEHPAKGDIVTLTYAGYCKKTGYPRWAKIYRRRPDLTWIDVVRNFESPHTLEITGKSPSYQPLSSSSLCRFASPLLSSLLLAPRLFPVPTCIFSPLFSLVFLIIIFRSDKRFVESLDAPASRALVRQRKRQPTRFFRRFRAKSKFRP